MGGLIAMCDKSAYRPQEPSSPRQAIDIYKEYLERIEAFKKRMKGENDDTN